MNNVLIIAGPTASGKSKLAMALADKFNGSIINIDSMQLYKEIPTITASPTIIDRDCITHYLYNHVSIYNSYSVALYLQEVLPIISSVIKASKLPIIVGGTGMYINSLINGIHSVPEITTEIKEEVRDLYNKLGKEQFYKKLLTLDPASLNYIKPSDPQRMIRSYEVALQTGKSLSYYYSLKLVLPLKNYNVRKIILWPDRNLLYNNCNQRFVKLLNIGGLEEVRKVQPYYNQINVSARKALGIPQLISYLNNDLSFEEAIDQAQRRTRQYAKRQLTWLNNKLIDADRLYYKTEYEFSKIIEKCNAF